ncbi:hypothetical protein C8255_06535 [filamentous cyanobacterium CCP3]|nr:hypothetical protein C8255_06535 [filamentous cyanobacterium CCP3]
MTTLDQANQLNAFRLRLGDALRPLVDASEIQATAARVLGETLGAARVVYLEVVSDGSEVLVHRNYTNGVAQLSGRYRLEDYDRNLSADHQDGRTQVVTDIPNGSTYTDEQKAKYREIDIAAHIDVPLVKNNRFVALLAVHHSTPRQWTETEIKQAEETAERTWAAVERARAEAALRESEVRLVADLAGMRRLCDLYATLATKLDLKTALDEILAVACEFTHTDRGCVQLVSDDGTRLEMFAWRGYADDSPFINHFRYEGLKEGCDRARVSCQRLIIEETIGYPGLDGTEAGAAADAEGIRATQSTPIVNRSGETIGILSTQFSYPHRSSDDELCLVDLLAWTTADFVERYRAYVALRGSEERYRTLFESIDQGFCLLEVLFDANDKAIDYRFVDVNGAFEQHTGLAAAQGKTILELVPHFELQWAEMYGQVAKSGEAIRFEADVPSLGGVFDVYAFPSGAPGQNLVAALFANITERKRREANLAFLAKIQDDCAHVTTAEEVMQTVGAKIGAHLNLSGCTFVDIDEAQDRAIVPYSWHRSNVPSLVGTYRISQFVSEEFYVAARAGETVVVNDTSTDARTDTESCAALQVKALINVPFLHDGQWKYLFNVYDDRPRLWRDDEIELFSELANRIFPRLERARAEAALRESETRLRFILDTSQIGDWDLDLTTEPHTSHRSLQHDRIFGYESLLPEWSYEIFLAHVHPDDRAAVNQKFQEALSSTSWNFECRIIRPDQSVRWIWVRSSVYHDASNAPTRLLGMVVDITDRKQTEAIITTDLANMRLLRDLSARMISEDNIQVLYDEIVTVAIALTQADAGTVQILDHATQNLLLLAAQGFDQTVTEYFYRVSAQSKTPCGVALTKGTRTIVDFDVPKADDPDGALRLIADAGFACAQSTPLISRSGKVIGMVSTHWRRPHRPSDRELRFLDLLARQMADLIDRRQTEAALHESEELKQSILDSSKDCIKVLTLDSNIVYLNRGGLRLLEIDDPMFVLNANWLDFWQGEAYEKAKAAIATAKAGNTGQFQGFLATQKGTPKWWDILITPVRNSAGQVTQLLAVSRDITKQKQAETERERLLAQEQAARQQAETANRIKDEFLAVLSHELRSPLNPILGWTRLLQNSSFDETRRTKALKTIERNAKLQAQLIEDLLDISRIMQGKLLLTVASVSLPSVISAAIETVRLAAETKQIQMTLDLDPAVASISGDAARLQQVVWNLLTNAVKFTPQGGQVTVELRQLNQLAQIRVFDTGKGINPQFLPHVFEYFRQEDGSTTRKFGGLGLGLAIVRQIVEMHGGTVWAESQGEDQGATFAVQLPTMRQTIPLSVETAHHSTEETSLAGVQILLVDDEPDTREFQAFLLEQNGASVTAVASGLEALQALGECLFDVLVSDIGMAEMDGYMLLQHIRSRSPEQGGTIPAIALTAYAAEIDQQRALQVGFQRHITKPVEAKALVDAIASLLEHS